jgi:hypothetical protein
MMLIDFLIIQLPNTYYLSMELEVLYKKMLSHPFPSNVEWKKILRFKIISTKLHRIIIIQMDEERQAIKVTPHVVETSQRKTTHKGKNIITKELTISHLPLIKKSQGGPNIKRNK